MIRLLALYPNHLNLNGDQGNITVLAKRLAANGFKVTIDSFQLGDDLSVIQDADFILLGHGSFAAWNALASELQRISEVLRRCHEDGVPMLAVSSGAEVLFAEPFDWFNRNLIRAERVSKFAATEFEGSEVLGYLNSDSDLDLLREENGLILTGLHGPVLAKNPKLADYLVSKIKKTTKEIQGLAKADEYAAKVRELELPLANE